MGQTGCESAVGSERSGLDRADRNAELFGNLAVRQPVEVLQLHHVSFVPIEVFDRSTNDPRRLDLFRVRGKRHEGGIAGVGLFDRVGGSPLLASLDVDGRSPCDRGEPWCEISACFEAITVSPGLEERLLRCLLGASAITEDPERDGEDEAAEAVVQFAHRVLVAGAQGNGEFGVRLDGTGGSELLHETISVRGVSPDETTSSKTTPRSPDDLNGDSVGTAVRGSQDLPHWIRTPGAEP
jgi:hypothetical protein